MCDGASVCVCVDVSTCLFDSEKRGKRYPGNVRFWVSSRVEFRYNGPASNGNLPVTELSLLNRFPLFSILAITETRL